MLIKNILYFVFFIFYLSSVSAWYSPRDEFHAAGDGRSDRESNLVRTDSSLILYTGGTPVLQYIHGLTNVPGRNDSLYVRSGFIHPLWSPDGSVLSRIHPLDHPHHLGLWHPWTKVTFRNRHLDFWNLGEGSATVRHISFANQADDPAWTGFEAKLIYLEKEPTGKQSPVINELFSIRLWHNPGLDGFLFDYTIQQECATEEPVLLDAYRYGGLGFRATEDWRGENRHYRTSEGKDIDSADGSRSRWGMIRGDTEQGTSAILFLAHPQNHEFPEPLRIWDRNMNDMFFNFCPVKQKSWTLEPGRTYTRKYRIFVTDTEITTAEADSLWEEFARKGEVQFEAGAVNE